MNGNSNGKKDKKEELLKSLMELTKKLDETCEKAKNSLNDYQETYKSAVESANNAKETREAARTVGVQSSLISSFDAELGSLNKATTESQRTLDTTKREIANADREIASLKKEAKNIKDERRYAKLQGRVLERVLFFEGIVAQTKAEQEEMEKREAKVRKSQRTLASKRKAIINKIPFKPENTYWVNSEEDLSYEKSSSIPNKDDIECVIINSKSGVEVIPSLSFAGMKSLSSVDLGNCVKKINSYAFSDCSELIEVKNSNSVEEISCSAFFKCSALESFPMPEVKRIGSQAFLLCKSLDSFTAPKVTDIENQAFYLCTNLKSFDAPNVKTIGEIAFHSCIELRDFNAPCVTTIKFGTFYDCAKLESFDASNVTTVGEEAFCRSGLKSFDGPNVISVGDCAFSKCKNMLDVSLPKCNDGNIGSGVFRLSTALKTISLPGVNIEKVVNINVLEKCKALETVKINYLNTDKFLDGDMSGIGKQIKTQIGKTPVVAISDTEKRLFDGKTEVVKTLTKPEGQVLESSLGPIVVIKFDRE